MEVVYHPLVRADVEETLTYYRKISGWLADEFQAELWDIIKRAAENPLRFHLADQGFRRANLKRFPYHLLYESRPESVPCSCATTNAIRSTDCRESKALKITLRFSDSGSRLAGNAKPVRKRGSENW